MPIEKLNLPVGRIVWGNPTKPQIKKNFTTKQPVIKEGKEVEEWACGIAIPKDKFLAQVWPQMQAEASKLYPNGLPRDFSWKMTDGDSIDDKGQPYNKREGYAGHYILKVSTEAFAPSVYKFENGAYRQLATDEIKCGDYVVGNIDIKAHTNNSGGLYINPNGFELVGYGSYIASSGAASPEELFQRQQHQLPPGASAIPMAGVPQALPMQPNAATPVGYPSSQLPPPAHDFVQNAGVPINPSAGIPGMQSLPPQQAYVARVAGYPMQPNVAPQVYGTAPVATTYPTSGVPGMPQPR